MNTINPLHLIDSILLDYASPKVRRLVHSLLALGLLVAAAWLAADGDWPIAVASLIGTFYAAVNKANTPAAALPNSGLLDEEGVEGAADDLSYEEAGGQEFPEDPAPPAQA